MQDPKQTAVTLSPELERSFKAFVLNHTGIHIQAHQQSGFEQTIGLACNHFHCTSATEYLLMLQSGQRAEALEFLIAGITVGESYFFRDPVQIDYLRDVWIPETSRRKRAEGSLGMRIWSAGCSNGQELYTLAMLLQQVLPDAEKWTLHLLGTDINVDALARCQRGHYSNWSMRTTPDSVRERFFSREGSEFVVNDNLKSMTRFAYLNLVADTFPSILSDTQSMDLILCRNVFIYFEHDVIREVMGKFRDCLLPEGLLMLAASDPVTRDIPELCFTSHRATQFYRRCSGPDSGVQPRPTPVRSVPPARQERTPIAAPAPRRQQAGEKQSTAPDQAGLIERLQRNDWAAAEQAAGARLSETPADTTALRVRATARANLGKLEPAAADCSAALDLDSTDKHAHFLHALVLTELNRLPEAGEALRKVLFLDSAFLEAHHQLGLLMLREGQKKAGLKSLRNALKLAENGDPQRILHGSLDMSYGRMAEILRQEISSYEGS